MYSKHYYLVSDDQYDRYYADKRTCEEYCDKETVKKSFKKIPCSEVPRKVIKFFKETGTVSTNIMIAK